MNARRRWRVFGTLAGLLLSANTVPAQPVLAAFTCTDVHVVFARGAMLGPDEYDFDTFYNGELARRILDPITKSAWQLGKDGYLGDKYVPVTDSLDLFGEGFGGDESYQSSVASGVAELNHYLTDRAAECAGEVYVLGGFSEGAQVIGEGLFELPESVRDRVAFVAIFGDPKLDLGNWPPTMTNPLFYFPPGCNGDTSRPWIRGSVVCSDAGGVFGARVPYLPGDIGDRVGSWCRDGDGACTGDLLDAIVVSLSGDGGPHRDYFDPDSDAAWAAREAAFRLQAYFAGQESSFDVTLDQFVSGQAGADLSIVFDTTGSMSGSIANAKSQATELAQQWTTLFENGRVGLVDFKDQGDPYVARLDLQLTSDANAFQTAVNALSASGGGDTPEAQLSGIMTALDGMTWASGATKAVVVITDAPGKDPEPGTNYTRTSVSQHALEIDPVAIYGVNVSTLTSVADWMVPMANATAGDVVTLQSGQSLSDALSALFDSVHASPVAKLDSPVIVQTGTAAHFNASDSFDASATITSYRWDFDGDGSVDRTTTTPTTSYTYPGEFHGIASVEVVADDGRSAIATADVSVDSVGLANLLPLPPTAATASISGPNQVTVSWTPASSDRADGYKVALADGTVVGFAEATDPHSIVIPDVDLSQAVAFQVRAANAYGSSTAVQTLPVGGQVRVGKAWGNNGQGQLGNGTTAGSTTAVDVSNLTGITSVAAGAEHSLAVKSDGTAWAWGQNLNGELGDGTTSDRLTPVQISGVSGVTAVAGGTAHSLVLKSDGTVWSFGYNQNGQLGDGTTTQRTSPVQVTGLTGITAIAAGSDHSLALKSDGTVWAWGKNSSGQLGDGSKNKRTTAVRSGTLTGVVAIAAGGDHSLALKSDGTVWAWGYNFYGELGDGTTTNRTSPVRVTGLTGVSGIAAGSNHSLALKPDGTVWAWGNNGLGQLGDGTNTNRKTAVRSGTLSGVVRVAAGAHHSLGLKSDGALWAWGYNLYGQVGDGTTTSRTSAVQVVGLSGIATVAGGAFFSVAATGG
jgi:alpha-tubulin suppressor-like RCC1 family protein/Mg-chelatase subunit ChlD